MSKVCAAASVCLFGVSLVSVLYVVQILAGLLAAASGAISLYVAIRNKFWQKKQ